MLNRRHALATMLVAYEWSNPARLRVGASTLEVQFSPGDLDLPRDIILQWISEAGSAVAHYYGRFPVPLARILLRPAEGRSGVFHGTTWGRNPPLTRISVGQHATAAQLRQDWLMTHELVHMTFPDIDEEHHWIEEGIATYVEPIARALIRAVKPASVWSGMMTSMHQGEPGPSDEGLDHTHTWGRTYWGGALFCLLADIRIRQETRNHKGLRDGLRAVMDAGGTIDHHWPLAKALDVADQATHTQVLSAMYSEMANKAVTIDLNALWIKLGISKRGDVISFDDNAPLAAIRRSITSDAD